mgnify:CR=1 FL=1
MSKVLNFSEIAPDIAFPKFNFYEFIIFFLTRKIAVNAELLRGNCILAMKNRQKIRLKGLEADIYKIGILKSRKQKLKGLVAASLRLKTLDDNPYVSF